MRPQPNRLNHPANFASGDQLASFDAGFIFQPFAVADRVNALGRSLHPAHFAQLGEGGEAGFVAHVILAVLHYPHAQGGTFTRDVRAHHHMNGLVVEDFGFATHCFGLGIFPRKLRSQGRGGRVIRYQCRARRQQRIGLAKDVTVVNADHGKVNHERKCVVNRQYGQLGNRRLSYRARVRFSIHFGEFSVIDQAEKPVIERVIKRGLLGFDKHFHSFPLLPGFVLALISA